MKDYTKIYVDGRIVGVVRGPTFVKKVRSSTHFLRHPRGIALDIQSLREAEQAGADSVRIEDIDTGRVFRASIHRIREKGVEINRGFGKQLCLPINQWHVEGSPEQLHLFA